MRDFCLFLNVELKMRDNFENYVVNITNFPQTSAFSFTQYYKEFFFIVGNPLKIKCAGIILFLIWGSYSKMPNYK